MHRTASPDTSDAGIEQELKALGKTAPRITSDDIKANIASEHYFTAADGGHQVTEDMVSRFLGWKLPASFGPDCGISFDRGGKAHDDPTWPVGTNLFTATEARAMLEHVLQPQPEHESLRLLTICVLVLRNGFTVTGESACASPENFDAEIGRKLAKSKALDKVWQLMGYELRSKLAREQAERIPHASGLMPHQMRVLDELQARAGELQRLEAFIASAKFSEVDAAEQARLREQAIVMTSLTNILRQRIGAFNVTRA